MSMAPPSAERLLIRPIQPGDNLALQRLIVETLTEFGCVGPGFASSDPELQDLYAVYGSSTPEALSENPNQAAYWVIVDEQNGKLLGGGGFSRLKGTQANEGVCELQKVYFHSELRGKGFGRKLVELCIQAATRAGYRTLYLETVPQMQSAVGLYEKLGFQLLPTYLGDTGHRSCTIFMSRSLGIH